MEEKEVKQEPKRVMEVKKAVVVTGGTSARFTKALLDTINRHDGAFKQLAKK